MVTKDELLTKLLRYHGTQYCMVEGNYVSIKKFYETLILLQQELGVLRLSDENHDHLVHPFVD